jgi:hypothetical protein
MMAGSAGVVTVTSGWVKKETGVAVGGGGAGSPPQAVKPIPAMTTAKLSLIGNKFIFLSSQKSSILLNERLTKLP